MALAMLRYLRGQKEKENPTSDAHALPTTTIPRDTHPAKPAATPAATPAKDASPDPTPQESAQATQQQAATAHPDPLGGRQEPPEAGAQRRRTSRCPDCKAAPLGTLDTPFAHEERLDDGRVKLASYVACAAPGCGYLAQWVRDPRTGRCAAVAVPDRLAERWCAVELCAALGTEPEPDDHNGCYVGEVRVAFAHVDWDGGAEQQQQQQQQAVAGEDLGYMLSAAVCEMLDDALEGRLEMGIFADGFGGGEETPEETGLVAPLCLRVVDDEPVSPRTVPAGFERGWFLSLGDETPESTESESPDSEIFARQV
ncbi:hypothetical protein M0657_006154 [Pyricularia oryzae]|nr:hypothetical protein M0657_006154 [Pyricularia oryzae]KAI7924056.1 hypothetical protein M9X92_004017 [Pyricularia oryzae]